MYLVDEKDVVRLEVCQQRRKVSRFLYRGTGSHADIYAHFVRNYAGKRGLSKSRRAVEEHVVKAFAALFRSLNVYLHVLLDLFLPDVLGERLRAQ